MTLPPATKMNALIVDSDMVSRARLKQALHHEEKAGLLRFHNIFAVPSLTKALHTLRADSSFDLILVSDEFGRASMDRFIADAGATRQDQYAFIVVLKPRHQDYQAVMGGVVSGAHGLLCEPYSINNLREIAEIAQKVRASNAERRVLSGIPLLIDLILRQIAERVRKLTAGSVGGAPLSRKYRTILEKMFQDYPEAAPAVFYAELAKALEKAEPRKPPKYDGASELLRKKYNTEEAEEAEQKKEEKAGIFAQRRVVRR